MVHFRHVDMKWPMHHPQKATSRLLEDTKSCSQPEDASEDGGDVTMTLVRMKILIVDAGSAWQKFSTIRLLFFS